MRFRLTCIYIVFSQLLSAQTDQQLHFERIEGLSHNTVYSIMKDKQGFLWIATADGLNRYDGVQMKIYKPSVDNKKGSFQGRIIRSKLIEDELEQIWFLASGAGSYCYNKKKDLFEPWRIQLKKDWPASSFAPLIVDSFHIWASNSFWGVLAYHIQTKSSVVFKNDLNLELGDGICDDKKDFWFLTNKGVLFFDRKNKKWQHIFKDKKITALGYSIDTVYLQTQEQLYAFNTQTQQLGKVKIENNALAVSVRKFYTDKKNNVWAGDETGNIYFKESSSNFFKWRGNINGENLSGTLYPVYSLYVDENDILWVGADVLGLQKAELNRPKFDIYPSPSKSKKGNSIFIYAIYEDEDNGIWLGTFRQGLLHLNKNTRQVNKIELPGTLQTDQNTNSVKFIRKDSQGNLWIGHSNFLFVRKKGQAVFESVEIIAPQTPHQQTLNPYSFIEYGDSLFFTTAWGIYVIKNNKNKFVATHLQKAEVQIYYDLFIDQYKNYWLAFEGGIYKRMDLNNVFGSTPGDTILFPGTGAKSFLHDSTHHMLWISTTGGLIAFHLPSGKYKNYTEADGIGNSYVYGALKNGNDLWLSTNRGLSKAVLNFRSGNVFPDISFTNFTRHDGLPDDEFNTGAFYKGNSGNLYFGTIKGVVWFKPGELNTNQELPRMVITNILVNDKKADSILSSEYITKLSLPYYKNNLFFQFRGIRFNNAGNVSYAYQLKGWDPDWIYSGTLNQVRYNKLPAGDYLFMIKAANGAGTWNENAYTVSITIHAPFWKTWWFYTLIGIVFTASVILVTRYVFQNRLKEKIRLLEKQRAVEAERNRISKDMHDEIGSGLTRIALMTELMNTSQQLTTDAKQNVDEIAASTRKLVETMSEIIWALNPQNDKLDNLLAYLREQTQHYFEPLNIHYKVDFPDPVPDIKLSNEQKRNIFLVSKEALNNALKHSGATVIELSAFQRNGRFEFSVSDNGKGLNTGANGLRNMQQRMTDINGGIDWTSYNGSGTKVIYWINI
jgi:signal transduction histidine kinase/ligand-binding sensor domain-containing protein